MFNKEPRPYTPAFHNEIHHFEHIQSDIEYSTHPEVPESLWWYKQELDTFSSPERSRYLSDNELNAIFEHIIASFDIDQNYHNSIRLVALGDIYHSKVLSVGQEIGLPASSSVTELFEYLGDVQGVDSDYPNDFKVSVIMEAPTCLLVFQYDQEECGVLCDDCTISDVRPGDSCEHMSDENIYLSQYQVMAVPTAHLTESRDRRWLL
jgi:hypothetical protein